jgi:hypothetical protein
MMCAERNRHTRLSWREALLHQRELMAHGEQWRISWRSKSNHCDTNSSETDSAKTPLLRVNVRDFLFVLHRLASFVGDSAFSGRHAEAAPREPPRFFVNFQSIPLLLGHDLGDQN